MGVAFHDDSNGCAVGANGTIVATTDGGANWNSEYSGVAVNLNAVAAADQTQYVAVGDKGTILETMMVAPLGVHRAQLRR